MAKNPADAMTTAEKQHFVNGTPKSLRNRQFDTLFNSKGNIRQRRQPMFTQPRREGTTLMESPVYRPEQVLLSSATYAKHLAMATEEPPTAGKMGVARLSAARANVANEKREVIAKEASLKEREEEIRRAHAGQARELAQMRRRVKELERKVKAKAREIIALEARITGMKAGIALTSADTGMNGISHFERASSV